ncbi:hypothetical protein like AT4G29090 [Hibiscus trionum]|uniref:Uncharacterized protein n=1 Tax=Hibiscus trionum TaxID=183268 RepID=A0A9W7HT64_HIBTR|nr:hypothetical protein like AT4G29090 [Hibiscus trionum]
MPASICSILSKTFAKFLWGALDHRAIHWISLDNVCRPKENGGLGFVDFKTKNRAMLCKWLWRYGSEPNCLWRRVIAAIYEHDHRAIFPANLSPRNKSLVWRNITNYLAKPDNCFEKNISISLGDGKRIQFWTDNWLSEGPLKVKHPRIFAIASKKAGFISDFGCFANGVWQWKIELRRNLFDWELDAWSSFMNNISNACFRQNSTDNLRWKACSSGMFSVKSFRNVLSPADAQPDFIWKCVWSAKAPMNVLAFVWKVIHGRIPTKVELLKRNINSVQSDLCPLCLTNSETIEHLLCHCSISWRVWNKWCSIWNINIVVPFSIKDFLLGWFDYPHSKFDQQIWSLSAICMLWSIWCMRNEVVFKGSKVDASKIFEVAIIRLGWWCKAKWPEAIKSISDVTYWPALFSSIRTVNPSTKRDSFQWVPPRKREMKFNIDGVVAGSFGPAGIGGCLRNEESKSLIIFSKHVGNMDATSAEITAIHEALLLFKQSRWNKSAYLIIESDCKLAVEWVMNPGISPLSFRHLIMDCLEIGRGIKWKITHILRESNGMADKLAKKGISLKQNIVELN